MTFGSDTRVVPSNIVLDMVPGPPREGENWWTNPQFAAMPPIAKLLWPLLYIFRVESILFTYTGGVVKSILLVSVLVCYTERRRYSRGEQNRETSLLIDRRHFDGG